jgi:hypothetical protein
MKDEDGAAKGRSPANCACVLALLLAVTTGLTASASDWRQFRGPNGSGIAASDASNFNASPAIAGRQLFLRSNRTLYCIESVQTAGAGNQQ